MFKGWQIISVTPAGRRNNLKILINYLLKNKHVIDRHELWLNTNDETDINYIYKIQKEHPDFFSIVPPKIKPLPITTKGCPYSSSIHPFFEHCVDPNTIYIRIDDDVCFFADNAFEELLKFRIDNPHYFIVYPLIINNSMNYLPTIFNQVFSPLGHQFPKPVTNRNRIDLQYLPSAQLALDRHNDLLSNINNLKIFECDNLETTAHININVIAWFGAEFQKFNGIVQNLPEWGEGEEAWLATKKPKSLGKTNAICGKSLAAHLTFGDQRLDDASLLDKLIEQYAKLLPNIKLI
jgi:hypothetical protein